MGRSKTHRKPDVLHNVLAEIEFQASEIGQERDLTPDERQDFSALEVARVSYERRKRSHNKGRFRR